EEILRAVAVMRVEVDDQHALAARGQFGRGDGDVVEQAESHRPLGEGMMPRRPHRTERVVAIAAFEPLHGIEAGTGGQHRGVERWRVGPWRGDTRVAYVAPVADGAPATASTVRRCCDLLAERGFHRAISAALGAAEARGFIEAGFDVRERLHLLVYDFDDAP